MQRAKAFFFVAAGVFLFALAVHLGATTARAQATAPVAALAAQSGTWMAVLGDGSVFFSNTNGVAWQHVGNVFAGGPTPTQQSALGRVKVTYR